MFDAIRKSKRIAQVILALIALPFMFWGVDSYMRGGRVGRDIASVGETKITHNEFQRAWDQYQQMRARNNPDFNIKDADTPEARTAVLNNLIDQRLLALEVLRTRIVPDMKSIQASIMATPDFQDKSGNFSMDHYQTRLRSRGVSMQSYEDSIGQELSRQLLLKTLGSTGIVAKTVVDRVYRFRTEERMTSEYLLLPDMYAEKIAIKPEAVQDYYNQNLNAFEIPERVKVDYIVLSSEELAKHVVVSEEALETWYRSNSARFTEPEQRQASHILIKVAADASDEEKAAAQAKAEEVLAEVKKPGSDFGEVAKNQSQDPGTATAGGNLGYFRSGMMVQPFEQAVFSMKMDEISDLVQTDYGYHIIKLTGIRPERIPPLSEVRASAESDIKMQTATTQFAEYATRFSDIVYEQSDSLKSAEELLAPLGITIQSSDWLERKPQPESGTALGVLGNAKVLNAIFTDDVIKDDRNTQAIETGSNALVSARITVHEDARTKPFDEVKDTVLQLLTAQEEQNLAKADGEAKLAQLKAGNDEISWDEPKKVSYSGGRFFSPIALDAIFKADVRALPVYLGVELPDNGGYAIYKIAQVSQPENVDDYQQRMIETELNNFASQAEIAAYFSALRQRYKIEINQAALLSEER